MPAATFVNAACALDGVGNDWKTMEMRLKAFNVPRYRLTFKITPNMVGDKFKKHSVEDPVD